MPKNGTSAPPAYAPPACVALRREMRAGCPRSRVFSEQVCATGYRGCARAHRQECLCYVLQSRTVEHAIFIKWSQGPLPQVT